MARRSDNPIGFTQRDFERLAAVVKRVEEMQRNDPYQATRWPREGGFPGNRFGTLKAELNKCEKLTPVEVNEYTIAFDENGDVIDWVPVLDGDGNQVTFKVVEMYGKTLPAGRWVSCVYGEGDIWIPVAAHCHGSCVDPVTPPPPPPPPPPSGCTDPQPVCPAGQVASCRGGVWICEDELPPPPGDCVGTPPSCPQGQYACCVNGVWQCCLCPPPPPGLMCPPGEIPWCNESGWFCAPV